MENQSAFDDVSHPTPSLISSSHHSRTPTKRPPYRSPASVLQSSKFFTLLILLTCCLSLTSATSFYIDEQMIENRQVETLESTFERLAKGGIILVDQSPPPIPVGEWYESGHQISNEDLKKRNAASSSFPSASSTLNTAASSPTLASTTTSSSVLADGTAAASPLPSPFDTGFSNNITTNCQSFMNSMLSNATFKACLPVSLLLQNSNSFFQVEKSLVRITQTLDYSCAANVTECSALMNHYASNITAADACSADLASENPLVQQAKLGLEAYKPLYTASCLRNPSTAAYCFADAITNASNAADSYIYFLPLNISLVGGSQPTCDSCLQNTMAVFEAASSDRSSSLASDYVSAAMQVNVNCGTGFVNASLAAVVVSAAPSSVVFPGSMSLLTLVLVVGSWLFL